MTVASTRRPIVLLHGCGGSPEAAWQATGWMEAVAARGRLCIAPRLPGHGRNDPSHNPSDYDDLAALMLSSLPDGLVDLVGFSLGAKISLAIALRYPDRVRRMVLGGVGDNVFAPEAIGEAAAAALQYGPTAGTPPPVMAFLETWDADLNDPGAIAAVLRRPANPIFSVEEVASIKMPLIIVNGGDDVVGKIGRQLLDALGIDQHLVPNTGHFDLTAHRDFQRLALDFLEV